MRAAEPLGVARVAPAYQQAADQLRALIVAGELETGDRLPPEGDLAAQFGVSRSTVREALRVLTSRDMLTTVRGTAGGTFVTRVRAERVTDYLESTLGLMVGGPDLTLTQMLEARELLELPAVRLAAQKRTPRDLVAMADAVHRERSSWGRDRRFTEHRSFHQSMLEASGNPLLSMMTEPLFRVLQNRFLRSDVDDVYWTDIDHEHELILEAVRDQDESAAHALMSDHLVSLRGAYAD